MTILATLQNLTQGEWDSMHEHRLHALSTDAHVLITAWSEVAARADLEIARRHAIKVKSSDGKTEYEVWFEPHPHCTCRGFQYRATCKHLEQARQA
jgi:hypothetical protein